MGSCSAATRAAGGLLRSGVPAVLLALGLAGCSAEAPLSFDPAARSTWLPAEERARLTSAVQAELPGLVGPEARVVALLDRDGDRLLLTAFAPLPDHGHVHPFVLLHDRASGVTRLALPARADAAAFAPGGRIAWVDHEGSLRLSEAAGEPGRLLRTGCAPDLAVAPDGTLLVAVGEEGLDLVTDLVAVDPATGASRSLASGPGSQGRAIPAPDGRHVVYVDGGLGLPSLRLLELRTGEDRALTSPRPVKGGGAPAGFVPPPARREGLSWLSPSLLSYDAGGGERIELDLERGEATGGAP